MSEPTVQGGIQRTIYISNAMWSALKKARAHVTVRTERDPSLSELVRWGVYRQLRAIRAGDYDPPDGYRAS